MMRRNANSARNLFFVRTGEAFTYEDPHTGVCQTRSIRVGGDHLSAIVDTKTVARLSAQKSKKKKFNFLTPTRFLSQGEELADEALQTSFLKEGTRSTIFAAANNFNNLYFVKFRRWFINDRIKSCQYIPRDLAQRFAFNSSLSQATPGLLSYATETRSLLKAVRRQPAMLPFDLHMQIKHGFTSNLAASPEAAEWKRILDIENVDLSKAIFRDRPVVDILCAYVNGCYGKLYSNRLSEEMYRSYRVGSIPVKVILSNLFAVSVGRRLCNYTLSESSFPLSHQATIAATILYRNHPLLPNPHTFVGFAKKRYDALVAKRCDDSHTRVARGKGDSGRDVPNILDPKYKVATDMCGITDFLDSAAYLASMTRLVSFRNAQTASAMLLPCRWNEEGTKTLAANQCPQMEFIARIVNTMSAEEQLKIVKFVDKHSHRICRELERELVAVSAFTAYAAHHTEYRYFNRSIATYQTLFDASTIMHTCSTSRFLPRSVFSYFSTAHRQRYGIFNPFIPLPSRGATLWTHLYKRESHARGNKFGNVKRLSLDKPFEYGDGAPVVGTTDFLRLTVLQKAALDYCFPQKLSLGEDGRAYTNPFNNYCSMRLKEIKQKSKVKLPFTAIMALAAREWYRLPQSEKMKFDIKVVIPKTETLSFPISGSKPLGKIDIKNLPSEPITTPLAPVNPNIGSRPHLVNLGRFQPTHPRFHKDPLIRIDFARPTERLPLAFFAKKALDIIRTHLDTSKIVSDPASETVLSVKEIEARIKSFQKMKQDTASSRRRMNGKKSKLPSNEDATGGLLGSLPPLSRLNKIPQQHLPDVVLAELSRSGIFDQKQPIPFDLEMGRDATEFRVSTLRAENPLRTAIVTRFTRNRAMWAAINGKTYLSAEEQVERARKLLIEEGNTDLADKMQHRDGENYLTGDGARFSRDTNKDDTLRTARKERKQRAKTAKRDRSELIKLKKHTAADHVRLATSQFVSQETFELENDETASSEAGKSVSNANPNVSENSESDYDGFDFDATETLFDEFGNPV